MQTFILKAGLKLNFGKGKYDKGIKTLLKDVRFPIYGCEVSLSIREGKPSHDLFWRGYGHTKVKVKDIVFEEIPDLVKPFTNEQFMEYSNKYSIQCAQEFLDCCDYSKPTWAYQIFNPPKNIEIWENPENQLWFRSIFGRELINFICGYSMSLANTYMLDVLKFERHLAFHFKYPMHKDGSMHDFMVEKFGKENTDRFVELFLNHEK